MDDVAPEDMATNVWSGVVEVGGCELKDIFHAFFVSQSELESVVPACAASSHDKTSDLTVLSDRDGNRDEDIALK